MQKRVVVMSSLLVLVSLLVGCGATPAPTTAPEPTAEPTQPPAPTEAAEATSTTAPMGAHEDRLILATTTSTQDSGLLDYLLPDFGTKVDVIAVGSGQAIKLGQDGNADVLLVHSRAAEDKFMAAGDGTRREDVMYNDFVIVGVEADPAGIKGMTDAAAALKKIADAKATFISCGDESGTHVKEKAIWKAAGVEPAGDWYVSAGDSMGATLTMASEKQAYTLSDRATYLARTLEGLDLVVLVEGDKVLFNPYGVIAVNPAKNPNIRGELANQFIDWIISVPTQEKIATFGADKFGQPLFVPDSAPWREAQSGGSGAPSADVALRITGPAILVEWTMDQLKAMDTLDVPYTNKNGETTTYAGVLLADLLDEAGVTGDDVTLILVADDGHTAEITLAEVQACADCIVAFNPDGGLRGVMPPFSGKMQVKGLIEIQVTGPAAAPVVGGIPADAALKITGKVNSEIGWIEADVRAMPTIDAQSTNSQGQTETYTGVPIKALLELASVQADASTLVFVASDGYTAEVPLADVQACETCIVSFRSKGGFSTVLPGFSGKAQVKGVVEIQVK